MQKFTTSVYINRSQQNVFDFLSKPLNYPQWMPLMQTAVWTSGGEPGVAKRFVGSSSAQRMDNYLSFVRMF